MTQLPEAGEPKLHQRVNNGEFNADNDNPPIFSIVIPVLNEIANLPLFIEELNKLLSEAHITAIRELVFVDDGSVDGTLEFIHDLSREQKSTYAVKIIERRQKLGSANAELVGCKAASNESIIKMDSDLQHPVSYIGDFIKNWNPALDLLVASRYLAGGGNDWSPLRGIISRFAQAIARLFIRDSSELTDPLSGFFAIRKSVVVQLQPIPNTRKLLLYVLASKKHLRIKEIPYVMKDRFGGESKIVDSSFSFIQQYLIEVLAYWKISMNQKKNRVPEKVH